MHVRFPRAFREGQSVHATTPEGRDKRAHLIVGPGGVTEVDDDLGKHLIEQFGCTEHKGPIPDERRYRDRGELEGEIARDRNVRGNKRDADEAAERSGRLSKEKPPATD